MNSKCKCCVILGLVILVYFVNEWYGNHYCKNTATPTLCTKV